MIRSEKHIIAISLIEGQIASFKHEQENMFIAGERKGVIAIQNKIDQLLGSLIALNELSVTKPLRKNNIKRLRAVIERKHKKEIRQNNNVINFDTMWHDNKQCAIVPLELMKHFELEI